MVQSIIVFARCRNSKVKGDYSFAGNIARDLSRQIKAKSLNMVVVLTSTASDLNSFESLYGKAINGEIIIDGEKIQLCSIETFDPVENNVVAFIEANRCNYAPAEIIKRILCPETKFLSIGNVNQNDIPGDMQKYFRKLFYMQQQPNLYEYFNMQDVFLGRAGFSDLRLGLPDLPSFDALPSLPLSESTVIPTHKYGFMYVNSKPSNCYQLMAQYMKLSGFTHYILVGDFTPGFLIDQAYQADSTFFTNTPKLSPTVTYQRSLNNLQMRNLVVHVPGPLVLSTGVLSTIEAMDDKKLTYYQDLNINKEFVADYLGVLKTLVLSDNSLVGIMPQLIIELSNLLFAPKPLATHAMKRTDELLQMSSVSSRLIAANHEVVNNAKGKLVSSLLNFIGDKRQTQDSIQLASVCTSLRKPNETANPSLTQALRRAATWGRLFELKVLLKAIAKDPDKLQEKDPSFGCTALHWAVIGKHMDCVRLLIRAGSQLDKKDNAGKTALHLAAANNDKIIVQILLNGGAASDVVDKNGRSPIDYTKDSATIDLLSSANISRYNKLH